jgi:putative transposase
LGRGLFITICAHGRESCFGTIVDAEMQLSGIGILADVFLWEIQNHTQTAELGEYVVMPNHVHVILILNDNDYHRDGRPHVETLHATSLQPSPQPTPQTKNETMSGISPKPDSVSTIIRSYKSAVSKHAHRLGFTFEWQERFHDHIIRDNEEYQRIVKYIRNNPKNWETDKFYH